MASLAFFLASLDLASLDLLASPDLPGPPGLPGPIGLPGPPGLHYGSALGSLDLDSRRALKGLIRAFQGP